MKRWIFTGKSDKRDLLLYMCKVLVAAGRRVLLVDATEGRKYRYSISNTHADTTIVEFNGFDIALGLTWNELFGLDTLRQNSRSYEINSGSGNEYDYVLYDMESLTLSTSELWIHADQVLWVSSFDRYEVESSAEWFRRLFMNWPQLGGIRIRPVYIRTVESYLQEDYIMGFMDGLPIKWEPHVIWIPWDETNVAVQLENEHSGLLSMKRISRSYKRAILGLFHILMEEEKGAVKRAFRIAERRQA